MGLSWGWQVSIWRLTFMFWGWNISLWTNWRLTIIFWGWHISIWTNFGVDNSFFKVLTISIWIIWKTVHSDCSVWSQLVFFFFESYHFCFFLSGPLCFWTSCNLSQFEHWLFFPRLSQTGLILIMDQFEIQQFLVSKFQGFSGRFYQYLSLAWSIWTLWLWLGQWKHLSWWHPWATITITKFEVINFGRAIGAPAKTRYSGHSLSLLWASWWLLHLSVQFSLYMKEGWKAMEEWVDGKFETYNRVKKEVVLHMMKGASWLKEVSLAVLVLTWPSMLVLLEVNLKLCDRESGKTWILEYTVSDTRKRNNKFCEDFLWIWRWIDFDAWRMKEEISHHLFE